MAIFPPLASAASPARALRFVLVAFVLLQTLPPAQALAAPVTSIGLAAQTLAAAVQPVDAVPPLASQEPAPDSFPSEPPPAEIPPNDPPPPPPPQPAPISVQLSSDRTLAAPGETIRLTVTIEVNLPDASVGSLHAQLVLPPAFALAPDSGSALAWETPQLSLDKPHIQPLLLLPAVGVDSGVGEVVLTLTADGVATETRSLLLGVSPPPAARAGEGAPLPGTAALTAASSATNRRN